MTTEPEAKKLPHNIGFDGMPEHLLSVAQSLPSMKGKYNENVLTTLHIVGTKQDYQNTPAGAAVIVAMDDRVVWMPTALMMLFQFGGCEWVAFISDAFIKEFRGEEATNARKDLHEGELEERFNGGDISVREAMIAVLRDDAGNEWHCQQSYSAGDNDECVWEEPQWFKVTEGAMMGDGYVSRVLKTMLGHREPTAQEVIETLMSLSRIAVDEVELPAHD